MTGIVIVEDDDSNAAIEEVGEVATEVAESVADAIVDAIEEITEVIEPATSDDTAIVVGYTMAEVAHINERLDAVEAKLAMTEATADLAVSLAVEAVEEPAPVVVEEEHHEPVPEDESPSTTKSKFNDFWFGKK